MERCDSLNFDGLILYSHPLQVNCFNVTLGGGGGGGVVDAVRPLCLKACVNKSAFKIFNLFQHS